MSYNHPFADLIGLTLDVSGDGALAQLTIDPARHHNPNGVAHGAVAYAMVDTAIGSAIMRQLPSGMACATLSITINYLAPIRTGDIVCRAAVTHMGRRFANGSADVFVDGVLVANASGNFALFEPKP